MGCKHYPCSFNTYLHRFTFINHIGVELPIYLWKILKSIKMDKIKIIALSVIAFSTIVVATGFTKRTSSCQKSEVTSVLETKQNQTINMFVTHGHCSTPFGGVVENLKVVTTKREDLGNPLEGMKISFDIDPNSFNVCAGDELTARIKSGWAVKSTR